MTRALRATLLGGALLAAALVAASGARASELETLASGLQLVPLGEPLAPRFVLESLGGPRVSLADGRGRALFLYFWESG